VEIAKSAGFNSPQLAAIRLNLSFIDTPWLAAGKFIFIEPPSQIERNVIMLPDSYPYYLANQSRKPNTDLEVIDKYSDEVATRVALADDAAIDEAIARAVDAVRPMQDLPAYARQNILQHCADRFSERAEELARILCVEAGKPINDSAFGLQAGIFTRDIYKINKAWDTLEMGGIVVGDVPSWRADQMPYGGIKGSGLGREGIQFAMEDMTEIRLMVTRQLP
jgi:acyl-CoA reductase-like NAD-dependent aldehyde dehydrogenase